MTVGKSERNGMTREVTAGAESSVLWTVLSMRRFKSNKII